MATRVQAAPVQSGAFGNGTTFVFPSNVTAGNHVCIVLTHSYLGCPPSFTDSQGNTYTARTSGTLKPGVGQRFWVFTAPIASSAALTATIAMGCGNCDIGYAVEVSGLDATTPFDGVQVSTNTANPVNSGSVTTTVDGAYVAAIFFGTAGTPSFTPGSGYTEQYDSGGFEIVDIIQSTLGAINPDATASSNAADVVGYTAAFKAAGGGGGGSSIAAISSGYHQRGLR